jgi:hypothetical protein
MRVNNPGHSSINGIGKKVHRVVTDGRNQGGKWMLETGPWLNSQEEAESWANTLRNLGYFVRVEQLHADTSRSSIYF